MKLKILSILNEGLKAGNSLMLVPNSIAEELETKDIFGLKALNEVQRMKKGAGIIANATPTLSAGCSYFLYMGNS